MSEKTVKLLEKEIEEELRNLALEIVEAVNGKIFYESIGGLALNFEKRIEDAIVIQFRWNLTKCKFELWDISENGEPKIQQYKNGQYENKSLVKRQLRDLNRLYKNKLRRKRLINFRLKGFR